MGQQNIWPSASVIVARNSLPENGSVSLKCIGNHWCSFTSSCAYPYLWKGDLIKSNKPNMWGNKNFSTSTKLRKMLTHSLSRCIQLQPTNLPVILSHSNITHILCCFYVILRTLCHTISKSTLLGISKIQKSWLLCAILNSHAVHLVS